VIFLGWLAGDPTQDRRRWDIEVFFKQVKQSLKLGSFLGHSANAVRWQIFTALLVYVLLRFMAHLSEWGHGFTRLFTVTRSALWERIDLRALQNQGSGRAAPSLWDCSVFTSKRLSEKSRLAGTDLRAIRENGKRMASYGLICQALHGSNHSPTIRRTVEDNRPCHFLDSL
jgi:hypothetical protein